MNYYKTADEKALEWHIASQHIKHLYRKGKIKGAVKRAGAWFIPDDASNLVRYTKSGTEDFRFVGTKNKIFNCAIELFMLKGFNDVSLEEMEPVLQNGSLMDIIRCIRYDFKEEYEQTSYFRESP